MKFCPSCGDDLKGSIKFCPECGVNLLTFGKQNPSDDIDAEVEDNHQQINPLQSFEPEESEILQKTSRELGTKLEESVEKIYKDRGYDTKRGQKMMGGSGQYNEIDVIAKRGQTILAIECKNYQEDRKVGIKEIRDFVAKLDDLKINKGLFVTSSEFSSDAIGYVSNNTSSKQIELWDGSTFFEHLKAVELGRTNNRTYVVENCLKPQGTFDDYSILTQKNKERISIWRRDLIFHPFYIVEFNLNEQFQTIDRKIHTIQNSGKYFVDGLSGEILYRMHEKGRPELYVIDDIQKQIVRDLENLVPTMIEISQDANSNISKLEPSLNGKDSEFTVKKQIVKDNKTKIPYQVHISKEKIVTREYTHAPDMNSILARPRLVYVPKMEIEFVSKAYNYLRIVLPASDITVKDEIAYCQQMHKLGLQKKHTFAVCEFCGIAKCENDILVDENDVCYCKDHASEELKESQKGGSFFGKVKRFGLKK